MGSSIFSTLTALVRKKAPEERRRSRRHAPPQLTPCQLSKEGIPGAPAALVHDLSRHGAGVLCEQAFAPGTVVQLLLVNASHTCALTVDYEICRCTSSPAGTYFLGGRFSKPLGHDELAPFLL